MYFVVKLKRLFCILVALYPIFNRYQAPIPFLTLSESILLLFCLFSAIAAPIQKIRLRTELLPFCLYLLIYVLAVFSFGKGREDYDTIGTGLRLLFLYVMLSILVRQNYSLEYGCNCIRKTALFLSAYAVLQVAFSYAGVILTSYIPLLPIMSTDMDAVRYRNYVTYGNSFRPCSLLNEPAHLCTYLLLSLVLVLFSDKKGKYWVWEALFLTVTCFVSKSSTGIIVSVFVWVYYFLKMRGFGKKNYLKQVVFWIAGAIALAVFLHYSGIFEYFLNRTFDGTLSLSGLLSSSRFYAIQTLFLGSDTFSGIIFGVGLFESDTYLPGWARLYHTLGLLGLTLVMIQVWKLYKKGNVLQKRVAVIYALLNIGTEILFGNFAVLFLSVIMTDGTGESGYENKLQKNSVRKR